MATRKLGRHKGSRNKGFFFRKGRGWGAKDEEKFYPLKDDTGEPLKDRATPDQQVRDAFDRWREERRKEVGTKPAPGFSATVLEVCSAYLDKVEEQRGKNKTYSDRAETLFDFCFGLPARFLGKDGKPKGKPTAADYLHDGYGNRPVADLKKIDIDRWLQAHPNWNGGKRTHIKALVRSLNYGVECGLLDVNPVKGYKTPKVNGRVAYITPEQETALSEAGSPALALAIKVLIRTGMRPGIEFCALTARHVKDQGERMELIFQPHESKTKRLRTIRVNDPAVLDIIRRRIELHPSGPLFHSPRREPWTQSNLSKRFRDARDKLAKQGMEFDKDCVLYATRHTYAKRILQGFWSGKATNIETLARLMGNSPQVCRDHYLQWDESHTDHLWASA